MKVFSGEHGDTQAGLVLGQWTLRAESVSYTKWMNAWSVVFILYVININKIQQSCNHVILLLRSGTAGMGSSSSICVVLHDWPRPRHT